MKFDKKIAKGRVARERSQTFTHRRNKILEPMKGGFKPILSVESPRRFPMGEGGKSQYCWGTGSFVGPLGCARLKEAVGDGEDGEDGATALTRRRITWC